MEKEEKINNNNIYKAKKKKMAIKVLGGFILSNKMILLSNNPASFFEILPSLKSWMMLEHLSVIVCLTFWSSSSNLVMKSDDPSPS